MKICLTINENEPGFVDSCGIDDDPKDTHIA